MRVVIITKKETGELVQLKSFYDLAQVNVVEYRGQYTLDIYYKKLPYVVSDMKRELLEYYHFDISYDQVKQVEEAILKGEDIVLYKTTATE